MVADVADDEIVGTRAFDAVAGVEALRAEVLAPHADPQRARAVALQPLHGGVEQPPAPAAVLVFAQDVQALELAVARLSLVVVTSSERTLNESSS